MAKHSKTPLRTETKRHDGDHLIDYKLCAFFKGFIDHSLHYPHFSSAYIKQHIERPSTDEHEMREYLKATHSDKRKFRLWLLSVFVALLLFVKASLYPLTVVNDLVLLRPQANIKPLETPLIGDGSDNASARAGYYQFSCLVSNCSNFRLESEATRVDGFLTSFLKDLRGSTNNDLISELHMLPHFSICHPWLSLLSDSNQYLNFEGLLTISTLAFFALIGGAILPLIHKLQPSGNTMLMFMLAPRVTRRVVLERSHKVLEELLESYENYCAEFESNQHSQNSYRRGISMSLSRCQFRERAQVGAVAQRELTLFGGRDFRSILGEESRPQVDALPLHINPYKFEKFTSDCVTVMRSNWWRQECSGIFGRTAALFALETTALFLVGQVWNMMRALSLRSRWRGLSQNMRQLKCDLWTVGEFENHTAVHKARTRHLLLDELDMNTPILVLNFATVMLSSLWPFMIMNLFYLINYVANIELICWLNEIKFHLRLAGEYVRQIKCTRPKSWSSSSWWSPGPVGRASLKSSGDVSRQQRFKMKPLRQLYKSLIRFNGIWLRNRLMNLELLEPSDGPVKRRKDIYECATDSNLEAAIMYERYVLRSIASGSLDVGALVELLQKLYINFRVFSEHVYQYGPTITIMFLFINLHIYGIVLLNIWYLRFFKGPFWIAFIVISLSWTFVNLNTLVASNFHAKAKGLQPLIWSLLADTHDCQDARIKHMRLLWLKQVQTLDASGGLATEAFRVRITHTRSFKMMIGTGTLIVFVLRI